MGEDKAGGFAWSIVCGRTSRHGVSPLSVTASAHTMCVVCTKAGEAWGDGERGGGEGALSLPKDPNTTHTSRELQWTAAQDA